MQYRWMSHIRLRVVVEIILGACTVGSFLLAIIVISNRQTERPNPDLERRLILEVMAIQFGHLRDISGIPVERILEEENGASLLAANGSYVLAELSRKYSFELENLGDVDLYDPKALLARHVIIVTNLGDEKTGLVSCI